MGFRFWRVFARRRRQRPNAQVAAVSLAAGVPAIVAAPSNTSQRNQKAMEDILKRQQQIATFIAGGIAGALSATVTCPIEVVKTHLQASRGGSDVAVAARGPWQIARNIANAEGFRGFFRGLAPTLIGILPARATYFWAYSTTKTALGEKYGTDNSGVHMASAAAAGITSNTLTNPIWVMKSRVQLQAGSVGERVYRGYGDAVTRIFREEGMKGFFRGLSASYWGVTEGAIQFVVYERIKKRMIENKKKGYVFNGEDADKLSPMQYISSAAVSKLIASALTYPHEVVRLRMREQPKYIGAPPKYRGMIQSLRLIAREEGRRGLYAGMGTHLARVVPNAALMFFTFEMAVQYIQKKQQQEYLSKYPAKQE